MTPKGVRSQEPLGPRNTLGVAAKARWFLQVTREKDIPRALTWADAEGLPVLVLGGGSNLVLASDYPGLVLKMDIRGRTWRMGEGDHAQLHLGAGENWDAIVRHVCTAGYRGLENLALIPGTVGAAPVQNIGAYGVELSNVLQTVEVYDRQRQAFRTLSCADCAFAYRDSLFKKHPDRFLITRIRLRLSRSRPFVLDYGELASTYQSTDLKTLTPGRVADTVRYIRQQKLPDPADLPNAGSFFKNPVVPERDYRRLLAREPELVAFPVSGGYKLAAGWLIDRCGWKGYRGDRVGVHARQALVLVNHNGGSGRDVLALAGRIRESVRQRFGVSLEVEPRIVDNKPR